MSTKNDERNAEREACINGRLAEATLLFHPDESRISGLYHQLMLSGNSAKKEREKAKAAEGDLLRRRQALNAALCSGEHSTGDPLVDIALLSADKYNTLAEFIFSDEMKYLFGLRHDLEQSVGQAGMVVTTRRWNNGAKYAHPAHLLPHPSGFAFSFDIDIFRLESANLSTRIVDAQEPKIWLDCTQYSRFELGNLRKMGTEEIQKALAKRKEVVCEQYLLPNYAVLMYGDFIYERKVRLFVGDEAVKAGIHQLGGFHTQLLISELMGLPLQSEVAKGQNEPEVTDSDQADAT